MYIIYTLVLKQGVNAVVKKYFYDRHIVLSYLFHAKFLLNKKHFLEN